KCIDSSNGNQIWSYPLDSQAYTNPVVSESGVIYIGDGSGTLHAVNGSGGRIWTKNLGSIYSSCVLGDNRVVYVVGGTKLYALNETNGTIVSSVELESYVESNPVLYDGKLFLADEAGYFYVVKVLSNEIQNPDRSWPMFQKDWYHSATR
ncbi:MAG: PQQ-binding-like beta-propeller repeat protein, partial [Nitrososphaerota archaeon]